MLEKTGNFNRDDKYKKQENGNARNKKMQWWISYAGLSVASIELRQELVDLTKFKEKSEINK